MGGSADILIVSDIHYAGAMEQERRDADLQAVSHAGLRFMLRWYRHFVWLRDPFAHNHLLEEVLAPPFEPEAVVANGDFSCDSAFIGVSDAAACESAAECLGRLRGRFGGGFEASLGDHELGKVCLGSRVGGLRLASWRTAREVLKVEPLWTRRLGRYVLLGVTSTLLALPVYEAEALAEEVEGWRALREEHLAAVQRALAEVGRGERIILFCHDPTALPFLAEQAWVRERLPQIERTVIGHLHSNLFGWPARWLAGLPEITFVGASVRRMSMGLRRAGEWRRFRPLLVPSLAGIELTRNGGYYRMTLDREGRQAAKFTRYRVRRRLAPGRVS